MTHSIPYGLDEKYILKSSQVEKYKTCFFTEKEIEIFTIFPPHDAFILFLFFTGLLTLKSRPNQFHNGPLASKFPGCSRFPNVDEGF